MNNKEYLNKHKFKIEYEELNTYNSNAGDCLIKAIMFSRDMKTEKDWIDIHTELFHIALKNFSIFNSIDTIKEYLGKYGYEFIFFGLSSKISIVDFLDENTKGNFIIGVRNHCFAYIDGIIYDYYNMSNDSIVEYSFERSKNRTKVLWYAKKGELK